MSGLMLRAGMKRREFIRLIAGAAAMPLAVHAQQGGRVRLVGILLSRFESDQEAKDRLAALQEALKRFGWIEGRDIRFDVRHAGGSADRMQAEAAELIKLGPDVIVASATASLAALQKATTTIPIVFTQVTDPVGAGFVTSLTRPGGNITGFTQHEFSIGVKWLELLKELAPSTERIALLYDPQNPATGGYRSAIKTGAPPFEVKLSDYPVHNGTEIERALGEISARPNSGLVILPGPVPSNARDLVVTLAAKHKLPVVYPFHYWVMSGGLAFYGIDNIDLHKQAASYVDRI